MSAGGDANIIAGSKPASRPPGAGKPSPFLHIGAAAGNIVLPVGDVNSAVGHGRTVNRASERAALRKIAEAELGRPGLGLRFTEPLQAMFQVDQTPFRVREIWQVTILGGALYLAFVLIINLFITPDPNLLDMAEQMALPVLSSCLILPLFATARMPAEWREAAITVNCCCFSLAILISLLSSRPDIVLLDAFTVTLPVIGVLFFARQPFPAALCFTAFSACGLLAVLVMRTDIPAAMRPYPLAFLIAAVLPALIGVYRLECSARRIWLFRLLQSLQIDDLATENVELTAQASAALRASEDRMRQAQKMEAVGQLTGGIAHDFNNLLTTVIGSLEALRRRGTLDSAGERLAGNALAGAERGARLTGQLLAFSRQQRLSPAPLSPAEVVAGIRELLVRTLGANTALLIKPASAAQWDMLADRNQLEMAVLNLVINARDAIGERGGTVSIQFANLSLSERAAQALEGEPVAPGKYVSISVRDTGAGMSPETMQRALEPFFTTKPAGAGTGLGLSQAYGFARQSGGTLFLESTRGVGTRVTMLLPRAPAGAAAERSAGSLTLACDGETILVAEDDALARDTIVEALQDLGYTVLQAADASAAMAILESGADVDLLLTDVIMPGPMNGVSLALAVHANWPELKVLFISGYNDGTALAQWPEPVNLLQKPFNYQDLANFVSRSLRPVAAG